MRSIQFNPRARLMMLGVAIVTSLLSTVFALAQEPSPGDGYLWRDVDGRPLPYQDHATIREVLRTARVVSRKPIPRGIAGVEKLVLESQGIRIHAAFRTVDVTVSKPQTRGTDKSTKSYRDAAIFESAAYELDRLLGIGRVPPVVERNIDSQDGTVQIWVEMTRPEVELIEEKLLRPPDLERWRQQKQIMYAFDGLIGNPDRNQGNLLIDERWNLWFIDHTRAFVQSSRFLYIEDLKGCERSLWKSLLEVDADTIRGRLEPFLESREITKLLLRRKKLINHIQKLIDKQGEEKVLFDLRPPAPENAGWSVAGNQGGLE